MPIVSHYSWVLNAADEDLSDASQNLSRWPDGIARRGSTAAAEWQCWDQRQLMPSFFGTSGFDSNHIPNIWDGHDQLEQQTMHNDLSKSGGLTSQNVPESTNNQPLCLRILVLFFGWTVLLDGLSASRIRAMPSEAWINPHGSFTNCSKGLLMVHYENSCWHFPGYKSLQWHWMKLNRKFREWTCKSMHEIVMS